MAQLPSNLVKPETCCGKSHVEPGRGADNRTKAGLGRVGRSAAGMVLQLNEGYRQSLGPEVSAVLTVHNPKET